MKAHGFTLDGLLEIDPTPDADHTVRGLTSEMTVDTNSVGFGAALALAADGHFDEADATDDTLLCKALAGESGTGTKTVLHLGFARDDSWTWTPGGLIYLSTTIGALTQTAPIATGEIVQILGYATHADRMFFRPDHTYVENA